MMTMDQPTKDELERDVADDMRCPFHDELVFEDGDDECALFICPAKGCAEQKVVRL